MCGAATTAMLMRLAQLDVLPNSSELRGSPNGRFFSAFWAGKPDVVPSRRGELVRVSSALAQRPSQIGNSDRFSGIGLGLGAARRQQITGLSHDQAPPIDSLNANAP